MTQRIAAVAIVTAFIVTAATCYWTGKRQGFAEGLQISQVVDALNRIPKLRVVD